MTITTFRGAALLAGALALTLTAQAQQTSTLHSVDLAMTFTAERAKIASANCGCFWLQGGSVEASVPAFRGLSAVAAIAGDYHTNIAPGVDLSKLTFMGGPRYALNTARWMGRFLPTKYRPLIFGEALFGLAHGFNSSFPSLTKTASNADALSMQFGGGVNFTLARGFGLRAIELDYVRTDFHNFTNDTQNDFRLAIGVSYHLGEH